MKRAASDQSHIAGSQPLDKRSCGAAEPSSSGGGCSGSGSGVPVGGSGEFVDGKPRLCIGASGSVATVKTPELAGKIIAEGIYIDLVVTKSAAFFMVSCMSS